MAENENGIKPRFGTVNFERRRHPRFSVDVPVEYWQVNDSKSHPGHTADISEGGLLLHISEEIEIGQNLRLKIFFDSALRLKSLEAKVQVVWKDFRFKKDNFCRIGVQFVDILPEDMEKLRGFLSNLMNVKISPNFKIPPRLPSALGVSIFGDFYNLTTKPPEQE